MATDVVKKIDELKKQTIDEQYGGKMSNQFVEELKQATMFQLDWEELLSAAPAALSSMGSMWVAAANPSADQITMTGVVPTGGFKFIPNRPNPTLRSILSDGKYGGLSISREKADVFSMQQWRERSILTGEQ